MERLNCFCENKSPEHDVLVANTDRFGNRITTLLCSSCGTLRTSPYYREENLKEFYKDIYRPLYSDQKLDKKSFFEDQIKRGKEILDLISEEIPQNSQILEIGCGAGGILKPFKDQNHQVYGIDYGKDYIEFGKKQGLDLEVKELKDLPNQSFDLVIFNHVLEHSRTPIETLKLIKSKLKPNGYVYIGLPGLYYLPIDYDGNIHYFLQNAHCWCFTLNTANYLLRKAGFELIKGNEKIMALYQVSQNSITPNKPRNSFQTNYSFIKDTHSSYFKNKEILRTLKKLIKLLIR